MLVKGGPGNSLSCLLCEILLLSQYQHWTNLLCMAYKLPLVYKYTAHHKWISQKFSLPPVGKFCIITLSDDAEFSKRRKGNFCEYSWWIIPAVGGHLHMFLCTSLWPLQKIPMEATQKAHADICQFHSSKTSLIQAISQWPISLTNLTQV